MEKDDDAFRQDCTIPGLLRNGIALFLPELPPGGELLIITISAYAVNFRNFHKGMQFLQFRAIFLNILNYVSIFQFFEVRKLYIH